MGSDPKQWDGGVGGAGLDEEQRWGGTWPDKKRGGGQGCTRGSVPAAPPSFILDGQFANFTIFIYLVPDH